MQRRYLIPSVLLAAALLAGCQHTAPSQQMAQAQSRASQPAMAEQAPRQAGASQQIPSQSATPRQGSTQQNAIQRASVDFRLAQTDAASGLTELKLPDRSVWFLPQPVLTRADLASVEPRRTQQGQSYVRFGFSQDGAQKLAAVSQRYPGKLLLLTLNNTLIAVPQIQAALSNGILDVGFSSDQQAMDVVRQIGD
ncbi:MAG: hypothetical protein WBF88_03955 [Pusillimonas sp.]